MAIIDNVKNRISKTETRIVAQTQDCAVYATVKLQDLAKDVASDITDPILLIEIQKTILASVPILTAEYGRCITSIKSAMKALVDEVVLKYTTTPVPAPVPTPTPLPSKVLFQGTYTGDWKTAWKVRTDRDFGWENVSVVDGPSSKVLHVKYPKGSSANSYAQETGAPVGGCQFLTRFSNKYDVLKLRYSLKFSDNFQFVKGGKLPGLYGGENISGGNEPDGTNGFSTRFMWRTDGDGEMYAYLATSTSNGTSLGRGSWRFAVNRWYTLEQQVMLDTPGTDNGTIAVLLDGKQVLLSTGLRFRTVPTLQIEGIFFSTFFGGSDASWATPVDSFCEFGDFFVLT